MQFPPSYAAKGKRYHTRSAVGRDAQGAATSGQGVVTSLFADIDNGLRVEDEGFAELIVGSAVSLDEIRRKSYGGWYLSAAQALELGFVAGLI
jgi:hypothetical protein